MQRQPGLAVSHGRFRQAGDSVFVCYAQNKHGQDTKTCNVSTVSKYSVYNGCWLIAYEEIGLG